MADNGDQQLEAKKSTLIFEFEFIGAAGGKLQYENVTPAQISALAFYLNWYAGRMYDAQADRVEQAAQMGKIAVPLLRSPVKH